MVKIFATNYTYRHPWETVTSTFWRKYPNPLAPHVKQIDCYERSLDSLSGTFSTSRLVACESVLPDWVTALGVSNRFYGYEVTSVNAQKKGNDRKVQEH